MDNQKLKSEIQNIIDKNTEWESCEGPVYSDSFLVLDSDGLMNDLLELWTKTK